MSSSAVLVHSICTILSNYGETVAFGELATAGLVERQFRIHPLCHRVLRQPDASPDMYPSYDGLALAIEIARSANADWSVCTMPLLRYGIDVIIIHREQLHLRYQIMHPPQLPVHWPPWTACYEIIERFADHLSAGKHD